MVSLLPSAIVLGLVAAAALRLSVVRRSPPEMADARRRAAWALAVTTALQAIHFAEEAGTGFEERLGAALSIPAMPRWFFLVFNLAWLGVWALSVAGIRSGRAGAFFAAWFLAIAGAVNGVAHPALALAAGSYFPGLISAPLIGASGLWLSWTLHRATARPGRGPISSS